MRVERRRQAVRRTLLLLGALLLLVPVGRLAGQAMHGMTPATGMMAWGKESFVLLERSDLSPGVDGRPVDYEGVAWYGGAYNRLWLRAEGEQFTTSRVGSTEAEVLFGRLISPYWDALIGVRVDGHWGEEGASRQMLSVGIQGLAPLRFELAPTVFLDRQGVVSGRLDASYQFLFTQRLIAEPSVDLSLSSRAVPSFGIPAGINDIVLGARLRYEIRRKFAPYAGLTWTRRRETTGAGDAVEGQRANGAAVVVGLRAWR